MSARERTAIIYQIFIFLSGWSALCPVLYSSRRNPYNIEEREIRAGRFISYRRRRRRRTNVRV